MAEVTLATPPALPALRESIRRRLDDLGLSLRVVAENLLGADAPIDLLAVEPGGRVALVLVGEDGADLDLVARALAQRAWAEARLRDWAQLAPGLGLRPELAVRLVLLAPRFGATATAAARALGAEGALLAVYRCIRNGEGVQVLLEALDPCPAPARAPAEPPAPTSPFRSGVSDADLGLSPEEIREFD